MRYEYRKTKACTALFYDKSGSRLAYIPAKEIKNQESEISTFFGDINKNVQEYTSVLVGSFGEVSVSKYQVQLRRFEKIIGYIPCVDEDEQRGYIRIIQKKYTSLGIALAIVAVLLALLIGGVVWFSLGRQNVNVDLDNAAIAYQMPDGLKNTDPNKILMPTFGTVNLQAGTRNVNISLLNPEGNPCYFRFTIFLKDSGKKIYETKWVMPGTAITSIEITEDLPVGEYPVSIHVDTGALNDPEKAMNNSVVEAVLRVVE